MFLTRGYSVRNKEIDNRLGELCNMLSKVGTVKFYMLAIIFCIVFSFVSYFVSGWVIDTDILYAYNEMDEELKSIISIQSWWIGKVCELSIPLFMYMALRFQLLKLDDDVHDKLVKLLPWIKPFKDFFISGLPMFFVFTAGVFYGVSYFLVKNADLQFVWLLVFPTVMIILALNMRRFLSLNPSEGWLGEFTCKNKNSLTVVMLFISLCLWGYTSVWKTISDRVDIFDYGQKIKIERNNN
ncbi:hypothetical protein SHPE106448_05405 [Shewanella pealeana]